jgi:hypothetical protein
MNTESLPADDDAFMDHLRAVAAEADPPPELTVLAARAAFATRRLDEELAELVLDSADGFTSVRSGDTEVRVLSFEIGDVTVEVQVQDTDHGHELRGLVDGARPGTVTIESGASTDTLSVPVDEEGWFGAAPIRPGPMRLRLTTPGGPTVVTTWVVL